MGSSYWTGVLLALVVLEIDSLVVKELVFAASIFLLTCKIVWYNIDLTYLVTEIS